VPIDTSGQFTVFLGGPKPSTPPCSAEPGAVSAISDFGLGWLHGAVVGTSVDLCVKVADATVEDGSVVAGGVIDARVTDPAGRARSDELRTTALCGPVDPGLPLCYSLGRLRQRAGDVGTWSIVLDRGPESGSTTVTFDVVDFGYPVVIWGGRLLTGFSPGSRPPLTAYLLGMPCNIGSDGSCRMTDGNANTIVGSAEVIGPQIGSDGTAEWTPPTLPLPPDGSIINPGQRMERFKVCFVPRSSTHVSRDCAAYFDS
jgi:hypothetical protein